MQIIEAIFSNLLNHPEISVFVGTFFLGDEMVYFFAFLAGQNVLSLLTVIIFGIIGNGGCDLFWYSVARYDFMNAIRKIMKKNIKEKGEDSNDIEVFKKKKGLLSLLVFSKFFYGTRLLAIFYVAKKEKKFSKIILYNTLAVIIWVTCVAIGIFILSRFISPSFEEIENIHKILSYAVIITLGLALLGKLAVPRVIKLLKKSSNKS